MQLTLIPTEEFIVRQALIEFGDRQLDRLEELARQGGSEASVQGATANHEIASRLLREISAKLISA